ncbi:MAG: alkaline phosphatase family protein, partial [Bacteroidaceae bacterium]
SSTITDELKIASQKRALVYSISPFRDTAILSAGHAANGAFWINKNTGKWCGTTYYGDFPEWINQYNESKSVDYRIKDIVWEPVYPRFMYSFLPDWRDLNFKYKFADNHENKYRRLITSPYVNDEVNALTETLLNKTDIGTDNITDLLCLTYYAGNYNHKSIQECATEIQDTYVRLDRSLANLLKIIKGKIDLKDVLFCITSTGYSDTESADHGSYNIPGGEFHMNRCAALLNMYLMATYGEGKYIETYYNQQIFLNHKLLENKNLNLEEVEKKTAEFLVQFSGVNEVYTSNQLLLGAWTPEIEKRRNSYNRKLSGDIMVDVLPGWTIVDEKNSNTKNVRLEFTPSPFIFFGYDIKPAIIQTPVTIDHIAPTLSRLIRIRAPNGCKAAPFVDIQ